LLFFPVQLYQPPIIRIGHTLSYNAGMEPRSCRLYVHDSWPRWLAVLLGLLALTVVALYFAAPDVPKLPAIPFLALLGFLVFASHRASQSWVEVSSDGKAISAIPSWYARSLAGESVITQTILPTAELVLCRNTAYDSFDGFSAILRGPGGSEQTVWKGMRGMDYRRCLGFSKEIQQRFGLPVRLLSRRVTDRRVEETEWTPGTGKINSKAMAFGLAMFLLPWVGIVVRLSTPNYIRLAVGGVLLWISGLVLLWSLRRIWPRNDQEPALGWTILVWTLEFAPLYLVVVLVTGTLLKD